MKPKNEPTRPPPGNIAKEGKKRSARGNASASARLASQHSLKKSNPIQVEYFKDIVATIREPLVVLDTNLRVLSANRSFYKFFKVKAGETVGRLIYDLGNRQWDIPALRAFLETILPQKAVFNDYEVEHEFPTIGGKRILLKPGPLMDEEWVVMKKHPTFAYEILAPIRYLRLALDIPCCHHEKWDSTGYPRGLKGEQISLTARIFAVVDLWDALISDRPYRQNWSKEKAIEHIRSGSGTHFDPKVVDVFMQISE
jgi:PAS domain-containing protein